MNFRSETTFIVFPKLFELVRQIHCAQPRLWLLAPSNFSACTLPAHWPCARSEHMSTAKSAAGSQRRLEGLTQSDIYGPLIYVLLEYCIGLENPRSHQVGPNMVSIM